MALPAEIVGQPDNELLVVDPDSTHSGFSILRGLGRVSVTANIAVAVEYLRRTSPALVVTELQLPNGSGIDICRAAQALPQAPSVLVTTADVERVPEALIAGCDGVLLKPFQPNLLVARVGRLLRERSMQLRLRAARHLGKSAHLSERVEAIRGGAKRVWPITPCPYCSHDGVTCFEHASMRRAWYACLACRKVWMAKRQD